MSKVPPVPYNPFKAQFSYNLARKTTPGSLRKSKSIFLQQILFSHLYMICTEKANSLIRGYPRLGVQTDWLQMGTRGLFGVTEKYHNWNVVVDSLVSFTKNHWIETGEFYSVKILFL